MPTITTRYKGDMLFETQLGNHTLTTDVPPAMGGKDRGPTPPEVFVASLGACVAAFVADYCQRTGIDTRDLSVDVSFEKAENPIRLVNLKVRVNLPHGECGTRREAVLRVAEHCPVHETINSVEGIPFELISRDGTTGNGA